MFRCGEAVDKLRTTKKGMVNIMEIKTYKCDECDHEFCEMWLWCKGKNVEHD